MPQPGKNLHHIALAAAMVIDFGFKQELWRCEITIQRWSSKGTKQTLYSAHRSNNKLHRKVNCARMGVVGERVQGFWLGAREEEEKCPCQCGDRVTGLTTIFNVQGSMPYFSVKMCMGGYDVNM